MFFISVHGVSRAIYQRLTDGVSAVPVNLVISFVLKRFVTDLGDAKRRLCKDTQVVG